jgi:hypothetical protein
MLVGMARVAKPGEWAYFAFVIAVVVLVVFRTSIGLPRMLAGIILALITPFVIIAVYLLNVISVRFRK